MKILTAAFTTAFLTGTFTLAGYASSYNSGEPPWVGTVIGGAIGLLFGLGVVHPRKNDSFRS
jgi:ElaB/YqjD/DUF883 family membrane-anchored ribosome-binding protein